MRLVTKAIIVAAVMLVSGTVQARRTETDEEQRRGYTVGVAVTLGASLYVIDDDVYRGPFSLEGVGSIGWSWFKLDLGLYTTFEDLQLSDTRAGYWNFQLRPGARFTPPAIPLYFRFAVPLIFRWHDFDYGVLFGLGLDIPLGRVVGLVVELDALLTKHLEWGDRGFPMELRVGVSFRL